MALRVWWLLRKDLLTEYRAWRLWPHALLVGTLVALLCGIQTEASAATASGLLWLAIFFSGTMAMERSFAAEREDDCWQTLLEYPLSPAVIYLSKLMLSLSVLALVQLLVLPLFQLFCGLPLLAHPVPLLCVTLLGSVGIAAVGSLIGALSAASHGTAHFTMLLAFPLEIPVVLAAAAATHLTVQGDFGGVWWRWVQLLLVFDIVYITLGILLFEVFVEE